MNAVRQAERVNQHMRRPERVAHHQLCGTCTPCVDPQLTFDEEA